MSARIQTASQGLLTIRVTGLLTYPELASLQMEAGRYFDQEPSVRILVIAEDFEGWARGGDWGDVSFQAKYDERIERMAIVGEKKWRDLSLLFTAQGLRSFPIEYFQPGEQAKAIAWLNHAHTQVHRGG